MKRNTSFSILFLTSAFLNPAFAEDLTVLEAGDSGTSPREELRESLHHEFLKHLEKRKEAFESLDSIEDCHRWQEERLEFFRKQIGGFPERTPLNPRIVGTLQGDGYRVEKILFESRPGFHVTANLYLPESEGPYPAVLIPCGHSHNGKAANFYQRASILMAKNGMAALCYDPIGQGERYQMIDRIKDGKYFLGLGSRKLEVPHPRVRYLCTIEHTAMGLGCILLGSNVAQFRIWDGMRCIDYLQSRDDIVADKIGCTGNSGGGTLTAYLMALDDRITAAAPGCFLTTFEKLMETKGAQDAEQNIFSQIKFGLDEPDLVIMRAPKPTLILAATRDATFDIEGTWDLFREAKRFYTRLGFPENVQLVEADAKHGFYIQQREAAARFMHRYLLGEEKEIWEHDPRPDPLTDEKNRELSQGEWTQEELYCSAPGQVLLMDGERSVFDLLIEQEKDLRTGDDSAARFQSLPEEEKRSLIRSLIGSGEPESHTGKISGTIRREGYHIEKVIFQTASSLRLAALRFVPEAPTGEAVLYLDGEDMKTDAGPGGRIEKWVKEGKVVLAAELRGIGESELRNDPGDWARGQFGPDWQVQLLAYLNGSSFVGMRTDDAILFAEALSETSNSISLVAKGEAAVPALHAAALRPDLFHRVRLETLLPTWTGFLTQPELKNQAIHVVHGVLRHYDLPDLIPLTGSGKVTVID
jgi:dienelactone hydrolase